MKQVRRRDTSCELALRSAVHRMGLRFRVDYRFPGLRRRADFVFPSERVAVFCDGCFWHGCPLHCDWPRSNAAWWREKITANACRDADTNARLSEQGWTVLRFWEHESADEAAKVVAEAVLAARLRSPALLPPRRRASSRTKSAKNLT